MSLRQTLSMIAAGTLGAPAALAQSSAAPRVGEPAPLFQGVLADGDPVALQDLRGRTVVLYFYPKDDTPGCTIEAKGFRDLAPAFEAAGAVVLGVSRDSPESHRKFGRSTT
jgi:peroxiredoxin Q/BCP